MKHSNIIDYINRRKAKYSRAIFLDRDGTINYDKGYTYKTEDLIFCENTIEAFQVFAKINYQIIIITNQAGIALNHYKKKDMSKFNKLLVKRIHKNGGRIDAIYYCSELEEKNFVSDRQKLHFCMKPNPGMLIAAANDLNINLSESIVIGDKLSDIKAGKTVGVYTILLRTDKGGKGETIDVKPDRTKKDLLDAAEFIKQNIYNI